LRYNRFVLRRLVMGAEPGVIGGKGKRMNITSKKWTSHATRASASNATDPSEYGPSSSDRVAKAVATSIMSGRWFPGQRLIEGDLARDLNVSRGTVREALKRLAAERVIALAPHRGAYVRVLTREEGLELLQVLIALYGFAATLAAGNINQGRNRQKFTAAYERLRDDGPKSDRIMHSVDRGSFYDMFLQIAGNHELARINPVAPTQILRMQVHPYLSPKDMEALFVDYHLLYEAISRGDGRAAKRTIEMHARRRASQMRRMPPEAFGTGWGRA
jgi:DNA-binding GntR family transcriptional regulator